MREKPYKFVVRLPMAMRDQIADAAKLYRRSMNSEIISRLQRSFDISKTPPQAPLTGFEVNDNNVAERTPLSFATPEVEQEALLINGFRKLPRDKQAALLDLLG